MKSLIALLALGMLAGCTPYKPVPSVVYGKSGAQFSAPDLCAALVACQKTETACYYDVTSQVTAQGTTELSGCKAVDKK